MADRGAEMERLAAASARTEEDARFEGALEVEDLLGDGPDQEPDFEALVTFGIKELFERQITLEGVVIDIITIISENSLQPRIMADKLQALLIPDEEPQAPQEG